MATVDDGAHDMTVIVIRAWYEDDQFRARVMFESGNEPQSVVVQSIDDVCAVFRNAVEGSRPPPT